MLPLMAEDEYFTHVLVLTCIFAIFALSYDLVIGGWGRSHSGSRHFWGSAHTLPPYSLRSGRSRLALPARCSRRGRGSRSFHRLRIVKDKGRVPRDSHVGIRDDPLDDGDGMAGSHEWSDGIRGDPSSGDRSPVSAPDRIRFPGEILLPGIGLSALHHLFHIEIDEKSARHGHYCAS